MRNLLVLLISVTLFGCSSGETETESPSASTVAYDSLLARKLGADEYGMRRYVMAFLNAGPGRDQDSTIRSRGLGFDSITLNVNKDPVSRSRFGYEIPTRTLLIHLIRHVPSYRRTRPQTPVL